MTQTEVRERLALEIAEKTKDSSIADGSPNGIAAAYLYVAQSYYDKLFYKETYQALQESQKSISVIDVKRF